MKLLRRASHRSCGALVLLLLGADAAHGFVFTPFGPYGGGGTINGQTMTFGTTGSVFEIDSYLNIAGVDLNGTAFGTSAQLSLDPLPAGLDFRFADLLSPDTTDLTLRYTFTNNTGVDIAGVKFLSYLDADINGAINPSQEVAAASGSQAVGQAFEVGTPEGTFPEILDNLLLGSLSNTNDFPPGTQGNVAMALSWDLGTLANGASTLVDVMISEDGAFLGPFSLLQSDATTSQTSITYSGATRAVPLPSVVVLLLPGFVALRLLGRRRQID